MSLSKACSLYLQTIEKSKDDLSVTQLFELWRDAAEEYNKACRENPDLAVFLAKAIENRDFYDCRDLSHAASE